MYSYNRRKFYRSRNGNIFGLCQGFADWMSVPVGLVRTVVIIVSVLTAVAPALLIYLVLALVIPPEPGRFDWR